MRRPASNGCDKRCGVWNFYSKKYHLYFVYGSNMNNTQIHERCSRPEVFAVARLPDYRMSFHGHSRVWDSGEEAITPCEGEDTWGVVYKLSFTDAEKLDAWQDVRMDGAGRYFHCPVNVFDVSGRSLPALTYKKDVLNAETLPSAEYLAHVVAGAVFHGLNEDYVTKLKALKTSNAGYPVPLETKFNRSLLADLSCDCGTR